MQKISVLLVDDHTVVRQGLRALLAVEPDIEIVGEADTGRQAVQLAGKLLPDVVVMDVAMPSLNGLEATRQILHDLPSCRVLVLSSYSDDEYVQQLTDAGAAGYLVKQTAATDLLTAIREVIVGPQPNQEEALRAVKQLFAHHEIQGVEVKPSSVPLRP